jgi:hypothetical protein
MSNNLLRISLTERQLLKAYIDNPTLIPDDDIFITEIAKEYHFAFLELRDNELSFIPEHILKQSIEYIDEKSLQAILDTDYQSDKIHIYEKELNVDSKLQTLESSILRRLTTELTKKGNKDVESIQSIYEELGETLNSIDDKKEKPLKFHEVLNEHLPILEGRINHVVQSTGCHLMDSLIPNPTAGLAIVGGFSGSLKTTLTTNYWAKQRLIKRLPTGVINTELSTQGYVDNFIPSMIKESYRDILMLDPDNVDFNVILEKYEKLTNRYDKHTKFLMFPKNSCSIAELKTFIKFCRKTMNLPDNTLLYIFADLLSMFSDFCESANSTKADAIENGVNKINTIALETNTLVIGTVQFKRPDFATGRKIEKEEDIDKLKASLSAIKSSGAWVERARWAFLLHNPYNIVHSYPCNPVLKEMIDPILEVTIAKDTYMGMNGKSIKYYFNGDQKQLVPYIEQEIENIEE